MNEKVNKADESEYSQLCDSIINGPCGFCHAKVMQGEKHGDGCPMSQELSQADQFNKLQCYIGVEKDYIILDFSDGSRVKELINWRA